MSEKHNKMYIYQYVSLAIKCIYHKCCVTCYKIYVWLNFPAIPYIMKLIRLK